MAQLGQLATPPTGHHVRLLAIAQRQLPTSQILSQLEYSWPMISMNIYRMRNTLVPATQQILRIRVCQSELQRLPDSTRCRNRQQRPPTSHPAAVSGRFSADYACFSAAWTGCPGKVSLYNPCVAPRRPPPRPSWRPPSSTVRV